MHSPFWLQEDGVNIVHGISSPLIFRLLEKEVIHLDTNVPTECRAYVDIFINKICIRTISIASLQVYAYIWDI
jgi:hypothetical protein